MDDVDLETEGKRVRKDCKSVSVEADIVTLRNDKCKRGMKM